MTDQAVEKIFYIPAFFLISSLGLATKVNPDTSQCVSLAFDPADKNGSAILNSTYMAAGLLSIDGVNNSVAFCRVFAFEPYAVDNAVVYEFWLPDSEDYNGRYLSVGK